MAAFAGFTATVLQKNNEQFFCDACGEYGKEMYIPYGAGAAEIDDAELWAVPVKEDYVKGFRWEIAESAPTYDSIACIRVKSLLNGDSWVVIGTREQYFATGAACCDASPFPTMVTDVRLIFPAEQYTCPTVIGGVTYYDANFALPVLQGGQHYEFAGSISADSNVDTKPTPLTPTPPTNITTVGALITWLNTNWAAAGTWSSTNTPISIRVRSTTAARTIGFTACAVPN
jgi:hypothetical protein